MKRRGLALGLGLAAASLAWLAPAFSQGLGDAAAREKQRRKATAPKGQPPKVFTDQDLAEKSPASPGAPPPAGSNPQPAGTVDRSRRGSEGGSEQASGESGPQGEWKTRFQEARKALRDAEEAAALADAEADKIAGTQPDWLEGRSTVLRNQRKAHSDVAVARQRLLDLEELARRAGVPPGWVRE